MQSQNKRLIKNTLAQYAKIIVSTIGALIYTRIILQQLGVSDYGIFSVVAGFIALFGILNTSMIVAVQRFLSYEIPTGNQKKINDIYSTSTFIHIFIAIIVIISGETIGLYFIKNYLVFPHEKLDDAIFVFHCVIISLAFNIISIPQQAVLIAYEKLYLSAIVSMIETTLKIAIAILLIFADDDKLKVYAILFVAVSIIVRCIYTLFVRFKVKVLRFHFKFNKKLSKELTGFASWNLFGAIANIGKVQGVNIILNMFFGTVVNASYGIANQINGQLLVFSSSIFQSANSQIIQSYRSNNIERMNFLVQKTSKFAFILYFCIGLFVFATTDELLYLWLGETPAYCSWFIKLMIINSCIELFSTPLMYITQATGKIRFYFIVISSILISILPLSYFLLKLGHNPYFVLYCTIAINIILLYIRILFVKSSSKLDTKQYTTQVIIKCFIITILSCVIITIITTPLNGIANKLIISIITTLTLVGGMSYFYLLTPEEKHIINTYVAKYRHKN